MRFWKLKPPSSEKHYNGIPGCACLPRFYKTVFLLALEDLEKNKESLGHIGHNGTGKGLEIDPEKLLNEVKRIRESVERAEVCEDHNLGM